ncbi:MAG TPA: pyridoxamine 5'-phosphate oxidase family protein [Frankiaceae bacterium]|jgi:hypothetical protein|nr:pyridoxamine 5'-phosphate oxidase family protein [Frankiaceae bacterium]
MTSPGLADDLAALQAATFASSPLATATSYPPSRRLTGASLLAALTSPRYYATVSTTRADGRPHAAPSAFVLSGLEVWLPTVAGAVRLRNVRANPYAVAVVADGVHATHLAVIAEGPCRIVDALPEAVEPDVVAKLERVPDWVGAWIVLSPSRLLSYAAEDAGYETGA